MKFFMYNGKMKMMPNREDMIGHLDTVFELLEKKQDEIKRLRDELDRPTDEKLVEAYTKIKELEQEKREIRQKSLYNLSESEEVRMQAVWDAHRRDCRCRAYHYEVTPTGIGTAVDYVCGCGFRETISDDF